MIIQDGDTQIVTTCEMKKCKWYFIENAVFFSFSSLLSFIEVVRELPELWPPSECRICIHFQKVDMYEVRS